MSSSTSSSAATASSGGVIAGEGGSSGGAAGSSSGKGVDGAAGTVGAVNTTSSPAPRATGVWAMGVGAGAVGVVVGMP